MANRKLVIISNDALVYEDMEYLLTPEDIKTKTADEINEILKEKFNFDAFKWQQENKIKISVFAILFREQKRIFFCLIFGWSKL